MLNKGFIYKYKWVDEQYHTIYINIDDYYYINIVSKEVNNIEYYRIHCKEKKNNAAVHLGLFKTIEEANAELINIFEKLNGCINIFEDRIFTFNNLNNTKIDV